MSDSDEDVALFVLLMDYLIRKMRSASRIPKQVSTFSGRDQMLDLLAGHDGRFVEVLRMPKECFIRLCGLLEENGVRETRSLTIQEQVMMFMTVVGHGDSNRRSSYERNYSSETINRHFNNICTHLVRLAPKLIGPPDFEILSPVIANNPNYFPYFQECIGIIDGTHIPCIVPAHLQAAYRNRKGYTSQNILAIVDFALKFTYMVAGWEGSAHDTRILHDAQLDPAFKFPHPPMGKYYLVDSEYANQCGYLGPYRGTNYYLRDRKRVGGDHKKEMFNHRHASLRNVVERTFGIWKNRFRILRGVPQYPLQTQRDIIIACAVVHNFIMMSSDDDVGLTTYDDQQDEDNNEQDVEPSIQQEHGDGTAMGHFRDGVKELMWTYRNQN